MPHKKLKIGNSRTGPADHAPESARPRQPYREHAQHILQTLGFKGEELEIQAIALATYLENYITQPFNRAPARPCQRNTAALREFERRIDAHRGESFDEGEPDCMYWMKHHEAALVIAALNDSGCRADLPLEILNWFNRLKGKLAHQWIKYDRINDKKGHQAPGPETPEAGLGKTK